MADPSNHSNLLDPMILFRGLSPSSGISQPPKGNGEDSVRIPQVGFDRNQTLRTLLNEAKVAPSIKRMDPCAVYISQGKTLVRPASVEGWIEACAKTYPLGPIRDFWEGVWNLSVCAWNYLDALKEEPWNPPSFGFPLSTPSFWQGMTRNRQIFNSLDSFFLKCGLHSERAFRDWIVSQVEFLYGLPIVRIPLGMASLALNAPAESYWIDGLDTIACSSRGGGTTDAPTVISQNRQYRGWRVDCDLGSALSTRAADIYLIQSPTPITNLWTDLVAFVVGESGEGRLYFRLQSDDAPDGLHSELDRLLGAAIGSNWGNINKDTLRELDPLETDWPWIGLVRSIHQIHSSLV